LTDLTFISFLIMIIYLLKDKNKLLTNKLKNMGQHINRSVLEKYREKKCKKIAIIFYFLMISIYIDSKKNEYSDKK